MKIHGGYPQYKLCLLFGALVCACAFCLFGFVTRDWSADPIKGSIISSDGEPIPGAAVLVVWKNNNGENLVVREGGSDAMGEFYVSGWRRKNSEAALISPFSPTVFIYKKNYKMLVFDNFSRPLKSPSRKIKSPVLKRIVFFPDGHGAGQERRGYQVAAQAHLSAFGLNFQGADCQRFPRMCSEISY